MRETSFEEVGGDGETCVVGIGGLPNILKPLWDTVGVDGLEEETRRVVPEESKPEGRVFRREGTHEIKKGKREEGGLNVRGGLMKPGVTSGGTAASGGAGEGWRSSPMVVPLVTAVVVRSPAMVKSGSAQSLGS